MLSRTRGLVFRAGCLCLAWLFVVIGLSHFWTRSSYQTKVQLHSNEAPDRVSLNNAVIPEDHVIEKKPSSRWLDSAPRFVEAIMDPRDDRFNRLECPAPKGNRYNYLHNRPKVVKFAKRTPKYFFALDLTSCAHILPRLLGSIVETMLFLGPQNCALSIVEGRSEDGTYEILKLLQEKVTEIGAEYTLVTNEDDPMEREGTRISALATLRNQALKPLLNNPRRYASDTTVLFINDVALCMEDILELIHQRFHHQADMTCAMDWAFVGDNPTFYDVWIASSMNGDSFFRIPEDGNWDYAWNLFWNDPRSAGYVDIGKPFQVFSCWNGAVAFTAKPLLEKNVRFRTAYEDECFQGEPKLFCKDLWYHGYGKIAVIPSINLGYSDANAKRIKELKGYVSRWVGGQDMGTSSKIKWQANPPEKVKCMRSYTDQNWFPWDEQLAEHGIAP